LVDAICTNLKVKNGTISFIKFNDKPIEFFLLNAISSSKASHPYFSTVFRTIPALTN